MQAKKIQQLAKSNMKNLELQLIFQSKIAIQFKIIESCNGFIWLYPPYHGQEHLPLYQSPIQHGLGHF